MRSVAAVAVPADWAGRVSRLLCDVACCCRLSVVDRPGWEGVGWGWGVTLFQR